jgi:hypothetical protein
MSGGNISRSVNGERGSLNGTKTRQVSVVVSLPDAVGHGLAGTLDGLGSAGLHRRPAPVRAGRHADQLSDMKGAAGLPEQHEIVEPTV